MSSPIKPSSPLPAHTTSPTAIPSPLPPRVPSAAESVPSEDPILVLARQAIEKGQRAQKEGRYPEAIVHYSKFIDLKTNIKNWQQSALRNRLWCNEKLKEWPAVVADSTRILHLEDPSPDVDILARCRNTRAEANWYLKKWGLAVLDSTQVTQMRVMEPPPADNYIAFAYWIRALAHASQEHWELAIYDYTKVLEFSQKETKNPFVERARLFRALAYVKHHEEEKAREELQTINFELAEKKVPPAFEPTLWGAIAEARGLLAHDQTSPSAQSSSTAMPSRTSPSKKRPAEDTSTQDTSRRKNDAEGGKHATSSKTQVPEDDSDSKD